MIQLSESKVGTAETVEISINRINTISSNIIGYGVRTLNNLLETESGTLAAASFIISISYKWQPNTISFFFKRKH